MAYNPDIHQRRSIRLRDYDYRQAGAYFVTLCSFQREALFGEVVGEEMRLNTGGTEIVKLVQAIPLSFPHVQLDAYVVMPNHLHTILNITGPVGAKQDTPASPAVDCRVVYRERTEGEAGGALASPLQVGLNNRSSGTVAGSLGAIVQNFKSVSTRRTNKIRNNAGCPVWQRNYYEHVFRNEGELEHIRQYIEENPRNWALDENHPTAQNIVGAKQGPSASPAVELRVNQESGRSR